MEEVPELVEKNWTKSRTQNKKLKPLNLIELYKATYRRFSSTLSVGLKLPRFQCKKCGRKTEADYEVCCTGSIACSGEKPPECCGRPMVEIIDDW